MTQKFEFLNVSNDAHVATVLFRRPPANAVNQKMYGEITEFFEGISINREVRAVVLAAEGPHFCAGNDLSEFATMVPDNAAERMWRVRRAFYSISRCAVPVIAAVHGVALGTGLAIAASCDFIIADEDAQFGLPELTVGVMGGARHLARIAPAPLVRRMFFTGESMTAKVLHDLGGCMFLCKREQLIEEAQSKAARIAAFSPTAVRAGKRVLDRIETMDLYAGYEFEQAATVRMSGHPDSKEALASFREKRAAVFDSAIDLSKFD